jgi:fluoride ion exporter CrcB/FEX
MTEGIMASSARFVMERAFNKSSPKFNFTMNEANGTFTRNNSATALLIKNLVFAESKSVRTSTIILAAFNVLAAFATACSILYDCYAASKRCNPKFKASYVLGFIEDDIY